MKRFLIFALMLLASISFATDAGKPRIVVGGQQTTADTDYSAVVTNALAALDGRLWDASTDNAVTTYTAIRMNSDGNASADTAEIQFIDSSHKISWSGPDGALDLIGFSLDVSDIGGTLPIAKGGTNNTVIGTSGTVAMSDGSKYIFQPLIPGQIPELPISKTTGLQAALDAKLSAETDTLDSVADRGHTTDKDLGSSAGVYASTILTTGTVYSTTGFQTTGFAPAIEELTDEGVVGNARPPSATDLQAYRSNAAMVASGNFSAILGGRDNTASGAGSTVLGGLENTASESGATVGGGGVNRASGSNSVAIGGSYVSADGGHSAAIGGNYITATGNFSSIIGGYSNYAIGDYSNVSGGKDNWAAEESTWVTGEGNYADEEYESVLGSFNSTATAHLLFVVGNGTSNVARSNAFSVTRTGDAATAGWVLAKGSVATSGTIQAAGTTTSSLAGSLTIAGQTVLGDSAGDFVQIKAGQVTAPNLTTITQVAAIGIDANGQIGKFESGGSSGWPDGWSYSEGVLFSPDEGEFNHGFRLTDAAHNNHDITPTDNDGNPAIVFSTKLQPAGYRASDGTPGETENVTVIVGPLITDTSTLHFKDGLYVGRD